LNILLFFYFNNFYFFIFLFFYYLFFYFFFIFFYFYIFYFFIFFFFYFLIFLFFYFLFFIFLFFIFLFFYFFFFIFNFWTKMAKFDEKVNQNFGFIFLRITMLHELMILSSKLNFLKTNSVIWYDMQLNCLVLFRIRSLLPKHVKYQRLKI
jgi:hypothetical protein